MDDILYQLDLCWQLFLEYVDKLSDEEAFWCKDNKELNVTKSGNRCFVDAFDWKVLNSIAYHLYHMKYILSNVINASFKEDVLLENIPYDFSIELTVSQVIVLHDEWIRHIERLTYEELKSIKLCQWPFCDKSFFSLALWVNSELIKDTTAIGVGRYLYGIEKNSG